MFELVEVLRGGGGGMVCDSAPVAARDSASIRNTQCTSR